jgi:hypothetical protein
MDDKYSVRVLEFGRADVRGPEVFWMSHWDEWVTLGFSSVLLRNASRCVLINAGMSEPEPALDSLWEAYSGHSRARIRFGTPVGRQLETLGIAAHEVTDVVISPFQAYALTDIRKFPNSRIHLSRSGWAEFHAPPPSSLMDQTQSRELSVPRQAMEYLLYDAWHRVNLLEDEDRIAPGITSRAVGIHHAESLAVTIRTGAGSVVWTDGIFNRANFTTRTPLGLTRCLAESAALQTFLESAGAPRLPAVDAARTRDHPEGVVGRRKTPGNVQW